MDVQRPCDVVEDILRIYGYNNVEIPTQLKSSLTVLGEEDKQNRKENLVGEQARGQWIHGNHEQFSDQAGLLHRVEHLS